VNISNIKEEYEHHAGNGEIKKQNELLKPYVEYLLRNREWIYEHHRLIIKLDCEIHIRAMIDFGDANPILLRVESDFDSDGDENILTLYSTQAMYTELFEIFGALYDSYGMMIKIVDKDIIAAKQFYDKCHTGKSYYKVNGCYWVREE